MFMPVWIVSYLKFLGKILDAQALGCEKYNEVVKEV